jgi:DMSO/TMAO reductase YedYZ molybdopterin-dependent catalytic subunit
MGPPDRVDGLLADDAAYDVNGAPLPYGQGTPLRLFNDVQIGVERLHRWS